MTNTNMSRQSSFVYRKLQEELEGYFTGIPVSCLSLLERGYQNKFKKPLDYKSLGVKDIQELVDDMGNKDMVLFFKVGRSKEEFVMSARMAEMRRQAFLKHKVEKLLLEYGEIPFDSFQDFYKDQYKCNMHYGYYALSDLDHLCDVLKDILEVEVANPSGAKVIKEAVKIYNLRKRKKCMKR